MLTFKKCFAVKKIGILPDQIFITFSRNSLAIGNVNKILKITYRIFILFENLGAFLFQGLFRHINY
jgi:hypothetical protein